MPPSSRNIGEWLALLQAPLKPTKHVEAYAAITALSWP